MKIRNLLFAAVAIAAVSCVHEPSQEQTPVSKGEVKLSSSSTLTVGAEGGSVEIRFTASGDWTAALSNDRAEWLSLSPAKGSAGQAAVSVSVDPNDTPDERSAAIRIKCGTATASVTVVQKQKDALTQTASKTQFGPEGGSFTIDVTANVEYSFEISGDWIHQVTTRSITTKSATFSVDANEDTRKREGSVTVKSSLGSETVTIYQEAAGPSIVLSAESVAVKTEGGSFTVDVNTNVDVTMSITEGAEWLSEVRSRSMSTHTYTFQAAANESTDVRTGRITFRNEANGVEASVTVTQMQKDALVVAQSLYEIGAEGGGISIEASANVELDVAISEPWVHQVSTRSMTTRYYDFAVEANPGDDVRECTIIFSGGGQESPFSQRSPWSLIGTIGGDSWTRDIEMKTDGKWHVVLGVTVAASDEFKFRKDGSWGVNLGSNSYSVTTYPGDCLAVLAQDGGNMKLPSGTFDFYLNPDQNRAYFLTAGTPFTYDGYTAPAGALTQTVTVRQDGADGFVANFKEEYKLSAKAQTLELRSRSSVDIAAESNCDWISVVGTRSMSTRFVTLQIAENTSEQSRTGKVVVSAPELGLSQTVRIIQSGAGEVYIPDEIFRAWLLDNCDADGDGILSPSECEEVERIMIRAHYNDGANPDADPASWARITSFAGLEYFPNLSDFMYDGMTLGNEYGIIEELDFSNNPNLNYAGVYHCPNLKSVNLGACSKLRSVTLSNLTSLETVSLPDEAYYLNTLLLYGSKIGPELDLSNYPSLQYLNVSYSPNLKKLWLLTGIELKQCTVDDGLEICYKGDDRFREVEFSDPVFGEVLISSKSSFGYNSLDRNGDGKVSYWELDYVESFYINQDMDNYKIPDGKTILSLEDLGLMKNLTDIYLVGCGERLSAPLPAALEQLTKLGWFVVSDANIYGEIPEFIGTMPNLKTFSLSGCANLTGSIPQSFYTNTTLDIYIDGGDFDDTYVVLPSDNLIAKEGIRDLNIMGNRKVRTLPDGTTYNDRSMTHYRSSTDGTGPVHADGEVELYHAATKGPGFDIFITGDGFTEANNTIGGTLETYMKSAAEDILAQDPYCKFAEYFNIWFIYAHSVREGTGKYDTAGLKYASWLNTPQGSYGTRAGGDFNYIVDYVQNATSRHEASGNIAVIMNTYEHGGTNHRYWPSSIYNPGLSVSYVTAGPYFDLVFIHETLGHGFGFLGDEYEDGAGEYNLSQWKQFGNNSNLDYLPDGDATNARWAPFIADSRYAGEKLGAFLSASDESARVYSSTENSIMRHNFPGEDNYNRFNAPSREAIWQHFQVLLHPEQNWSSWEDYVTNGYDREEFISFDLAPAPASVKPRRLPRTQHAMPRHVLPDGRVIERKLPPLHPPIILDK